MATAYERLSLKNSFEKKYMQNGLLKPYIDDVGVGRRMLIDDNATSGLEDLCVWVKLNQEPPNGVPFPSQYMHEGKSFDVYVMLSKGLKMIKAKAD